MASHALLGRPSLNYERRNIGELTERGYQNFYLRRVHRDASVRGLTG